MKCTNLLLYQISLFAVLVEMHGLLIPSLFIIHVRQTCYYLSRKTFCFNIFRIASDGWGLCYGLCNNDN